MTIGRKLLRRVVARGWCLALVFGLSLGANAWSAGGARCIEPRLNSAKAKSKAPSPLRSAGALQKAARIDKRVFGKLPDGTSVDLYTLKNGKGLEVEITNYGGAVVAIRTHDRSGRMGDIALGYSEPGGYVADTSYFGALIGRYANRIAVGSFKLNGVEYKLARNNDPNHLHGGVLGFNKVVWQAREVTNKDGVALELTYLSKDTEEGYPGNLSVTATYVLTNANELRIEYSATTDKDTVVNLTHHSYFNLAGAGAGDILSHVLKINADRFTPVDATLIPTGELKPVKGTPFDFNMATAIGSRINQADEQLVRGNGYDHNFVLNKMGRELSLAAKVYEPTSGRLLEMWTTEPGVQLYTGNFLNGVSGKAGKVYNRRGGFCLEAQHFPDSPNQPAFPSTVLKPGARYTQTTVYKFSKRG
ncbi:MAG: galactose mutarotase [Pyrinomonadaceae bacterium]|nr:galactose mutarotase [Pyrinomonadaceae bacterium]